MTKRRKEFDAVDMKRQAQERVREEFAGKSDEEIRQVLRARAEESDHPVWAWWRKVRQLSSALKR
jgi:hypothetical protein